MPKSTVEPRAGANDRAGTRGLPGQRLQGPCPPWNQPDIPKSSGSRPDRKASTSSLTSWSRTLPAWRPTSARTSSCPTARSPTTSQSSRSSGSTGPPSSLPVRCTSSTRRSISSASPASFAAASRRSCSAQPLSTSTCTATTTGGRRSSRRPATWSGTATGSRTRRTAATAPGRRGRFASGPTCPTGAWSTRTRQTTSASR